MSVSSVWQKAKSPHHQARPLPTLGHRAYGQHNGKPLSSSQHQAGQSEMTQAPGMTRRGLQTPQILSSLHEELPGLLVSCHPATMLDKPGILPLAALLRLTQAKALAPSLSCSETAISSWLNYANILRGNVGSVPSTAYFQISLKAGGGS